MSVLNFKTAVITGPTGTIGMALIDYLIARGVFVYAVCRKNSPRSSFIPKHDLVKLIECNLENLDSLSNVIKEPVDVFYHFAWENAFGADARNNMESQVRNIAHTINAVRSAKMLGCSTFIGAGSQAEYGRVAGMIAPQTPVSPENGYGMAKLCAGQMSRIECQKMGIRHIWVRILSIYGPYDGAGTLPSSIISALLKGDEPKCTRAEQLWDYLYCKDAAEAFHLIALNGKDGAIYVLGSGKALPLKQYIIDIQYATNPNIPIGFGKLEYLQNQVMHLQADISSLTRDTGFAPKTDFVAGIKETIEWIRGMQK